jgi:hypothetical protein
MNKNWMTPVWSLLIIGLSVVFGLRGEPTEMGIIVLAGAIALSFLNLDKIQRFKGAGFEAEMKKVVAEANATIDQLRKVATTSAEATLTDLMAGSFFDGITFETRLKLHDQVISSLKEIGAPKAQIEAADEMWRRGIGVIYHRGIRAALEGRTKPDQKNAKPDKQVLDSFQDLLKFEEWRAPSAKDMRQFIQQKGLMKPHLDELLNDCEAFEKTGILKRPEVLVKL